MGRVSALNISSFIWGIADDVLRDWLELVAGGSTLANLNEQIVGRIPVALPPLAEQIVLVEHLDKVTADIDTAIARARRQIELMEEYRTRLVADVVAGKLDVREAAELLPHQEVGDGWPEDGPPADFLVDDDRLSEEPAEGPTIEGEVAR